MLLTHLFINQKFIKYIQFSGLEDTIKNLKFIEILIMYYKTEILPRKST